MIVASSTQHTNAVDFPLVTAVPQNHLGNATPLGDGDDCRYSGLRHLLLREQVGSLLQLYDEKLQILIDTRQITAMRIAGEERFDSSDIYRLIEAYKSTASRRAL
jgi:hypothetical protein